MRNTPFDVTGSLPETVEAATTQGSYRRGSFGNVSCTVGYFLGERASRSDLAGGFEGDASTLGLLAGVYGIKELTDSIFGSAYLGEGLNWASRTKVPMG